MGTIISARAKRRQLQRAAALDRGFDKLIVQERADIRHEFRVPFCCHGSRIGRALGRNDAVRSLAPQARRGRGAFDAKAGLTIWRRDTDQHAIRRR